MLVRSCDCVRVCPRLCSWMTACACGRACWSVQLCVSLCVHAPARERARASLVARAPVHLCTCKRVCACVNVCSCECHYVRVFVCMRVCLCARAHARNVWMHLYACCLRPIADSREASRRGGALKVRPLRALATRTVASSPVWHTAPARACALAHAWRARSGAHPCSVGRFCAQFFAARPMQPSALKFDLFIFVYLFCYKVNEQIDLKQSISSHNT